MDEEDQGHDASESHTWRMLDSRLWLHSLIIVGGGCGFGGALMLKGASEGSSDLAIAGVVYVAVSFIWAWIQCWLPMAIVTSTDLRVVNRLRRHLIPLEDIQGTLERAPYVTFVLTNGRRVQVSAIQGWHMGQKWTPKLANHAADFVEAVLAAKERKIQRSI